MQIVPWLPSYSTRRRCAARPLKSKYKFHSSKEGAFVAQSIATYPITRAIRKLGSLNAVQLAEVETAVFKWLGRSV